MDKAPLEIQQADEPRGLTVRIAGHVDMRAAEALGDRLMPICAKRPPLVVLDLSGVTFIGSMGLGALVTFRKAVIRCAGSLRLAAVPPPIWDIIVHARLEKMFEKYDTVEDALATPAAPQSPTGR